MSIQDEINARIDEGRLFYTPPALPSIPVVRSIFVTGQISSIVLGPWDDKRHEYFGGRLRNALDRFTSGQLITATLVPYEAGSAFMARLDKPEDETWDIRIQDPRPALRVLGRFADKDLFIATDWYERKYLDDRNSREWRDAIEKCKTDWKNLFPAYDPMTGENVRDYLSNVSDIGDP